MKKILVPTDFSIHAENALIVATQLAKKTNAKILVMHMMGLGHSDFNKASGQEALEGLFHFRMAEKNFKEFLDKDYLKGLDIEQKVQNEKAFSQLNEIANEENVDLIVMGSHGTTGLVKDIFVGSNTEKMVRNSDVPVLVIKNKIDNFKMDNIVFACDFDHENASAYKKAMNTFKDFGSKIHMLYVNTPGKFVSSNEIESKVSEFMNNVQDDIDVVYYSDYTVENGVFNYCDKVDADLIAIPTHGRKGLAHFFAGSIGEDIANHSHKPVITFKI